MNHLNLEQSITTFLLSGQIALKHLDITSTKYTTSLNANRFLSSLFDCFIAILNITDFSLIVKMSFQVMFNLFKPSDK